MGTRNLTLAVVDGTVKVAQYGQWDGYPDGQGATVLRFVREFADRTVAEQQATVQRFRALREATDADYDAQRKAANVTRTDGWVSLEESDRLKKAAPQLNRDMAAEVLAAVANGTVDYVALNEDFALDGLFCEWAYVVDFDQRVLEVYSGFQHGTVRGRWADQAGSTDGYSPVGLLATYAFDDLPDQAAFVHELEPEQAVDVDD